MTQVKAWTDGKGRYEIAAKGHATGSVAGCAYISGILYSLAGYLTATGAGRLEERRMEPGDVVIRFRGGVRAEVAWEMAVIGLRQLEGSYPDIVRVEEGERADNIRPYEGQGRGQGRTPEGGGPHAKIKSRIGDKAWYD